MWLGIDVGGTFTDAVVVDNEKVIAQAKSSTTHENLLLGILAGLDKVLRVVEAADIERVALSTTIVTNTLIQGKTDKVGLILLSGPGMDFTEMLPDKPYFLSGYIDHRGREIAPVDLGQLSEACHTYKGKDVFAVVGKFSVRNPKHERAVGQWLKEHANPRHVTLSSEISGALNFLRRANSAYYNAAVWQHFGKFASAVESAAAKRGIIAPIYILKADGGTLPLAAAKRQPIEAIFTGPAASALGIMAMNVAYEEGVSLDIGGTTTDIALWQQGIPLFATRGANVSGHPTAVRALWLKSVGIGGDSYVRWEADSLEIGPMRLGPAMALGGLVPTISDAMIVAGDSKFGDLDKAKSAVELLRKNDMSLIDTAHMVLQAAAHKITQEIEAMCKEKASEPVYKVDDIVHSREIDPKVVIGVGGGAAGLLPYVAREMNIPYHVPKGAMVANAIGAAMAKPTCEITLRADTAQGYYTIAELGVRERISARKFTVTEARNLAVKSLKDYAAQTGIEAGEVEILYEEEFNLVRGFHTVGKIITCRVQIKPGVLSLVSCQEAIL